MKKSFFITLTDLNENGILPPDCAFCDMSNEGQNKGANLSPKLVWGNVPEDTKSFALLCIDIDIPTDLSNKNKPGISIPAEQKRTYFVHWMVCNLPQDIRELPKGFMNKQKVIDGFDASKLNSGSTGYSKYFGSEALGYWGPCSPTNDLRPHRYIFRLYALNTATLPLSKNYEYDEFKDAVEKAKIATANVVGIFTRNELLFD